MGGGREDECELEEGCVCEGWEAKDAYTREQSVKHRLWRSPPSSSFLNNFFV